MTMRPADTLDILPPSPSDRPVFMLSIQRSTIARSLLAGLLVVAALASAPAASGLAMVGKRVTVALFGDSVTEGLAIPNFLTEGLAPQLSRDERAFGFLPGGAGLIPAAPFRWHFNSAVSYGTGPSPSEGWTTVGDGFRPGFDGPSGYSAWAFSPLATATVSVTDPDLKVLFNSTPVPCTFIVSAADRTWTLETYRPGPSFDAMASIRLPPGEHELTVHGSDCGFLSFDGVIAQRPVPPGRVQMEVDNLGHAAQLEWFDLHPRVERAILDQHYDISVFLYGYLTEALNPGRQFSTTYLDTMITRARIARAHGGACLIVEPTPIDAPPSAVTHVSRLDRTVARRAGCSYTTVLAHLWPSWSSAEKRGLILVDGVHPTARGYKLIAHALAPLIAGIARTELSHRSQRLRAPVQASADCCDWRRAFADNPTWRPRSA
jgi:hypothetical protein